MYSTSADVAEQIAREYTRDRIRDAEARRAARAARSAARERRNADSTDRAGRPGPPVVDLPRASDDGVTAHRGPLCDSACGTR